MYFDCEEADNNVEILVMSTSSLQKQSFLKSNKVDDYLFVLLKSFVIVDAWCHEHGLLTSCCFRQAGARPPLYPHRYLNLHLDVIVIIIIKNTAIFILIMILVLITISQNLRLEYFKLLSIVCLWLHTDENHTKDFNVK